ncbi:MAG: fimbrial protein [Thermomicrobiales bacterium]|jgi:type IV pilus assembly protein PilN|nr:MAG: fimbrial protein [Thermomicrobiales bacterium]
MIRVNLLPHREEKRRARRQQFYALAGLALALGAAVVLAVHTVIAGYISTQESKNTFLKSEIVKLDKEIDEIKRLKEQTDALLARKQVIESLQSNRAETVILFNELAKQVPEGVYLKSIKQAGLRITIQGFAQSNARVSTLMRNLDASTLLEQPNLVEIKSVMQGTRRMSDFNLNVTVTRAKPDNGKAGQKPAAAQAGAKKS